MNKLVFVSLVSFGLPCCAMSGTNGMGSELYATVTRNNDFITVSIDREEPGLDPWLGDMMNQAEKDTSWAATVQFFETENHDKNEFSMSARNLQRLVTLFPNLGPISLNTTTLWREKDFVDLISRAVADKNSRLKSLVRGIWAEGTILKFLGLVADTFPHVEKLMISTGGTAESSDSRGFDGIAKFHELKHLNLYKAHIDGKTLGELIQANPKIEWLRLDGGLPRRLQTSDLSVIAQLRGLKMLALDGLPIGGPALRSIVENNSNIEELGLKGCQVLEPRDFDVIATLSKLKVVDAQGTRIDPETVENIKKQNPNVVIYV